MHILFKPNTGFNKPDIEKYIFDHIANTIGWFVNETELNPSFEVTFSDISKSQIKIKSENRIQYSIPLSILQKFVRFLKCDDTPDPEKEPPIQKLPILDEILFSIEKEIRNFCKANRLPFVSKLPWPGGKSMAVSITHDVDITRKYGLSILTRDVFKLDYSSFKKHYRKSVFRENPYWNFEKLLELYREKNIRTTFFFISRPWENLHYRYNIKNKKYRQLLELIRLQNHEIGLHSSRYAFDHPNRIRLEKNRMEHLLGAPVVGVRQHYLRLLFPDAWRMFETNGFLYDSSCGYNSSVGFRAGTSLPFLTYNFRENKYSPLMEVPFTIMDYPWRRTCDSGTTIEDLFHQISDPIEKTGGLLNLIWHPHNFEEPQFRALWDYLFFYMKNKGVYADSLSGIIKWWKKRAGISLKKYNINSEYMELIIDSPNTVDNLCLEIISPKRFKSSVGLSQQDESVYNLVVPHIEKGEHYLRLQLRND